MDFIGKISTGKSKIAVLIDPDKINSTLELENLCKKIDFACIDYIFVGGSIVDENQFKDCIKHLRAFSKTPIIIFPGGPEQLSNQANGLLLLSLISGRNPDFLIGHHVATAKKIKQLKLNVIPTGYILIDGGKPTAVSYVSQTTPIPSNATSLAVSTAIAGELLGLKTLFLDAGSGANHPVSSEIIRAVRREINVPLIVGGGIQSIEQIETAQKAGADIIVIGNKIEEDIDFLLEIANYIKAKKLEKCSE